MKKCTFVQRRESSVLKVKKYILSNMLPNIKPKVAVRYKKVVIELACNNY
jgi:hypothetical protein